MHRSQDAEPARGMAERAGAAGSARRPAPTPAEGQDLLLLTDQQPPGHALLRLPYSEATVLDAAADPDDIDIKGQFGTVAVDRSVLDLGWLDRIVRSVLRWEHRPTRILVALNPTGELAPEPPSWEAVPFDGLGWGGLEIVYGRVCAVLQPTGRPNGPANQIAAELTTAQRAVRLATTARLGGAYTSLGEAERLLEEQVEVQHRSERALLTHLARLVSERRQVAEPPPPTLGAVIRRSKLGPAARWAARRARLIKAWLGRAGAGRGRPAVGGGK